MAKTQKYTEDQLLDAVVKYAEVCKRKIKTTELAKWARANITGLEEVRAYHFTRPILERDKKGSVVEKSKLCTRRIEELNKSRSISASVASNTLLRASNIDSFFKLSIIQQRNLIVETREVVERLEKQNALLRRENDSYKKQNKEIKELLVKTDDSLLQTGKKVKKLDKLVNYIIKTTDEENRKRMLAEMGITDGKVSLTQYQKCLMDDMTALEQFDDVIKRGLALSESIGDEPESLKEDFLKGLLT